MADVEPGEKVDQPSPTPPRLDRVGVPGGMDTTRFSNGAGGPRENVTHVCRRVLLDVRGIVRVLEAFV